MATLLAQRLAGIKRTGGEVASHIASVSGAGPAAEAFKRFTEELVGAISQLELEMKASKPGPAPGQPPGTQP